MIRDIVTRFAAVGALIASVSAFAQQPAMTRGGKADFSLYPLFTEKQTYEFQNGASARTDVATGVGLSWVQNFDDHWAAGIEGSWSRANYQATVTPAAGNPNPAFNANGHVDVGTLHIFGNFNFSSAHFTPFVTGGFGITYIDSNIPSGPSQPVCWWYPYYGQVCSDTQPTKSWNNFSYNAGIGLRWDARRPDTYFFRGLVNREWVSFSNVSTGTLYYDQIRIDFGTKF